MRRTIVWSLSLVLVSALLVAVGCDDSAVKQSPAGDDAGKPSASNAKTADAGASPRPTVTAPTELADATTLDSAPAAGLTGKVLAAGSPIAGSTVTLYAAGEDKPEQLCKAKPTTMGPSRSMSAPKS